MVDLPGRMRARRTPGGRVPGSAPRRSPGRRRGVAADGTAPLEVVLCLPILLGLWIFTLQVASAMHARADATVKARNKAWHLRHGPADGLPLYFVPLVPLSATEQSKALFVSNLFGKRFRTQEATHSVVAGAWDYRDLPLDRPPEFVTVANMVISGKTQGLQAAISQFQRLISRLATFGLGDLGSRLQKLIDEATEWDKSAEETGAQAEQKLRELQAEIQKKIAELKKALEEINKQIESYLELRQRLLDEKQQKLDELELDRIRQEQACQAQKNPPACVAAARADIEARKQALIDFYDGEVAKVDGAVRQLVEQREKLAKEYHIEDAKDTSTQDAIDASSR